MSHPSISILQLWLLNQLGRISSSNTERWSFAVESRQNFDLKIAEMKTYFLFSRDMMCSCIFDATSVRMKYICSIVKKATVVFPIGDSSVEAEFVIGNVTIILIVLETAPEILVGIQCYCDLASLKAFKISDFIKEIFVSNTVWALPVEHKFLLFCGRIWDLILWAPWLLRDDLGSLVSPHVSFTNIEIEAGTLSALYLSPVFSILLFYLQQNTMCLLAKGVQCLSIGSVKLSFLNLYFHPRWGY